MAAYESWKVYVAWQSAPLASAPIWADVTSDVDTAVAPIRIVRGRQENRTDIRPSTLSLTLRNDTQKYTPGNPTSTLYPHVKPGKRIRVVDVIGGVEYALFDGYLEFPEIQSWKKGNGSLAQHINLTAVDRLGRLDRSRSCISTLGEHIMYNRGSTMVGYWSLLQDAFPVVDELGGPQLLPQLLHSSSLPDTGSAQVVFGSGTGPDGDDGTPVSFTCATASGVSLLYYALIADYVTGADLPAIAAGQTITVVGWFTPDLTRGELLYPIILTTDDGPINVQVVAAGSGGQWRITKPAGALTGNTDGGVATSGHPVPVALRFGITPNTLQLWVGPNTFTATVSGSAPGSVAVTDLQIAGIAYEGSISHLQLYVGDSTDFTHTKFLAQFREGWNALDRQRVDERLTTLAGYAGLASTDVQLDRASASMRPARLQGGKFGPLLRSAAATDNGLLFTRGSGAVVFHGRQRRYNPPLAATVQLTWLAAPGLALRTEQPTNVQRVTATSGAAATAINEASVDSFAEYAGAPTGLDTACNDDVVNLAKFITRMFADPRQRAGLIAFELNQPAITTAVAQTILGREISDMVALDGLPAYAPEGLQRFHIEGITHKISYAGHRVEWSPGAVIGTAPGLPDPFPRVGAARVGASTRIPF